MRKTGLFFVFLFVLNGLINAQTAAQAQHKFNTDFDAFKQEFVDSLWVFYPAWATYSGYHAYDHVLKVPDAATYASQQAFLTRSMKKLQSFDISLLSTHNRTDYFMIRDRIEQMQWSHNVLQAHTWNPASYNPGGLIYEILSYKKLPLEKRLDNMATWLKNVPAYYKAAEKNLTQPVLEYTQLAIEQAPGVLAMFKAIEDSLGKSAYSAQRSMLVKKDLQTARKAAEDFYAFTEKTLLPLSKAEGARSFRLGKDLYEQKFKHEIQSSFTAAEIYQKALERKDELHYKMAKIALDLWPKYFGDKLRPLDEKMVMKKVLDAISANHVHRDSFLLAIENQIPELEAFVKQKDLMYLDPNKPLVVRETPAYMRGVAGASISAPGPYNPESETYYNVTPLTHYTETQAESYLREYNHYILQILNIHEAIPGHYTQLVYSNKAPSIIKSLFGNGAMIEGWAVYTELMMLENGYGNNDPEMWLMYYKWHLRSVCNTILDYHVHVLNMDENTGVFFLTSQAFQEETEARGKWKRATLSSVQLCSYFTGFYEIYSLREELRGKNSTSFNLKSFHEEFLSYGSTPVKYIREMMLENKGRSNQNPQK